MNKTAKVVFNVICLQILLAMFFSACHSLYGGIFNKSMALKEIIVWIALLALFGYYSIVGLLQNFEADKEVKEDDMTADIFENTNRKKSLERFAVCAVVAGVIDFIAD